jgi:hypothetical protein
MLFPASPWLLEQRKAEHMRGAVSTDIRGCIPLYYGAQRSGREILKKT